jgi:hypothetical protein
LPRQRIADHSNNVDIVSLFFGFSHHPFNIFLNQGSCYNNDPSFNFGHPTGTSRGPLNTLFVNVSQKSCAMQHLAAETADAASLLDMQSAVQIDANGLSPSSLIFDGVSACHQPLYFSTYLFRSFSQP